MKGQDWENEPTFEPIKPVKRHGHRFGKRNHLPDCNGKRTYKDKPEALESANALVKSDLAYFLRVYKCPHCLKWHLTSKPLKPKKRR